MSDALHALYRQGRIVWFVFQRELKSKFVHTPFGILTALLEPLAILGLLTLVFSTVRMREALIGDYLLPFFATGYLPVHCFKKGANYASTTFNRNRKSLYACVLKPLDLFIAGGLIMTAIMICLMTIITVFFIIAYHTPIPQNIAGVLSIFLINGTMGIAIGAFNQSIETVYPFWKTIFSVATTPLILLSGVFYTAESLPQVAVRYLEWNPFFQGTEALRTFYFAEYVSPIFNPIYYGGSAMVIIFVGLSIERLFRPRLMRSAA